ncbi:hypothetical protein D3C71_1533420 [compost metagenome]
MLVKRTDLGQPQRRVAHRQQIKGGRNALRLQPGKQSHQQCTLYQPHRQSPQIPSQYGFQGIGQRGGNIPCRAKRDSPNQGVTHLGQQRQQNRKTLPLRPAEIVTFRICGRLGQMIVAMMLNMAVTVQPIGIPHRQGKQAEQLVEPWPAGGMAVDQLMLQREIPSGRHSQQRCAQPGAKLLPIMHHTEPTTVNQQHNSPGRQFQPPDPLPVKLLDPRSLFVVQIVAMGFG